MFVMPYRATGLIELISFSQENPNRTYLGVSSCSEKLNRFLFWAKLSDTRIGTGQSPIWARDKTFYRDFFFLFLYKLFSLLLLLSFFFFWGIQTINT